MQTTITLTDREAETLRHALRLFAEGPYSRRAGSKPGYEADYSKDEYEIYFRKAVESLREKAEGAR